MALAVGNRIGTYAIVAPLGAGGMGEVYRAKDLRLGREVALKLLPAEVASSANRLARFEREARTVAGLNHPNIITLYSIEDHDGLHFLTMELVEGETLSTLVAPGGLQLPKLLELAIPLADALVAAHERGVIHRDLKPGNVMVTRQGRVKVLDFGLAKMMDAGGAVDATRTATAKGTLSGEGQVLGTLLYMAPEQVRGEVVDARSDLFSLGIMLYELATGRRPFAGGSPAEVASSILRDTPEPLAQVRPDFPEDLDRIVGRCLEKEPRARFQTALDVGNDLRRLTRTQEHSQVARPSARGVTSIAVLPFVNRSHDQEDEYFSDGLADELLTMLTKIRGLRVVARSSAFTFKGKDAVTADIGRALNVATVLEGSVRKAGNRVRISVQLVNVADGYHLWSERYDRTLEDIFAVQDDIAQSVVKELRAALWSEEAKSRATTEVKAEVAAAARGRGQSAEAHRLYLLARYLIDRGTRADMAKGIEHLKEALQLDPTSALAWAELGGAYSREADVGWVPVAEGYERAREAVGRALSLEPDLAEAHAQMAWTQMAYDWDWRGAEASYRRALELAPGNALVLRGAGTLADSLCRVEVAIDLYRRASEQDPLSSTGYHNLGSALRSADRLAQAEEAYRKALELAPQRFSSHANLSLTLLAQGRAEEALDEAMREPHEAYRLWVLAIVHHAAGRHAESDAALRELTENHADDHGYQIASVHAARGEADAAFDWLERAYALRDGGLAELKANPQFRALHSDPRWAVFLGKVGFEAVAPR